MIRDYFILDNALKDPEWFVEQSKSMTYYTKQNFDLGNIQISRDKEKIPSGNWGGFRTQNLVYDKPDIAAAFGKSLSYRIFDCNMLPDFALFFQLTCKKMDVTHPGDTRWHKDDNSLFAGLVYLSKKPSKDSGTQIVDSSGKLITIKNKFNRLVIYKGFLQHRVQGFFGSSIEDCRNTLVFFIHRAAFSVRGNVAEPGLLQRS